MQFEMGDKVEAIKNGLDYSQGDPNSENDHNYEIGWVGTVVLHRDYHAIQFDNGRLIVGCDHRNFRKLPGKKYLLVSPLCSLLTKEQLEDKLKTSGDLCGWRVVEITRDMPIARIITSSYVYEVNL